MVTLYPFSDFALRPCAEQAVSAPARTTPIWGSLEIDSCGCTLHVCQLTDLQAIYIWITIKHSIRLTMINQYWDMVIPL